MITTVNLSVPRDAEPGTIEAAVRALVAPALPVRWAVVAVAGGDLAIEAAVWAESDPECPALARDRPRTHECASVQLRPGAGSRPPGVACGVGARCPFVAAQILPTGIGLATGGYAGDGTPATNLLAAACDVLVAHPNAVNAAALNWAAGNVLYVEGALLDAWLAGEIALAPVRANRIGLLVDRAVAESGGIARVENAAAAFKTVGGGRIETLLTSEPLALKVSRGASGTSGGSLGNPGVLLEGACRLVERGADAIALVADFSPLDLDSAEYLAGRGPDPIGGLEAILSHLVALELGVPCAHAPYLPPSAEPCDPRAAAEEVGSLFLLSVLRGLQRAPRPVAPARGGAPRARPEPGGSDACLAAPDVVIAPATALGGPGTLAAAARGIPIVAVDNPSLLAVTARSLGIPVLPAASYAEAAGLVLALRAGIAPEALSCAASSRARVLAADAPITPGSATTGSS